jgi:hypothetical protein
MIAHCFFETCAEPGPSANYGPEEMSSRYMSLAHLQVQAGGPTVPASLASDSEPRENTGGAQQRSRRCC